MILFDVVSDLSTWSSHLSLLSDTWQVAPLHNSPDWLVLAQQLDTDPFRGFREAFGNFFESGQAWAFLAGVVFGYLIRSLTSYG
jgi:hypothetical protein